MFRFINFFLLARVSLPFLQIYIAGKQLKREKGHLSEFWEKIQEEVPDLTRLDGPLQRRIQHYLFANSLTTQWFATLLNHSPTDAEKKTGYYIATSTPLADFLVDQEKLSTGTIFKLLHRQSNHAWQDLTARLYELSMEKHPDPPTGQTLILKTLEAQEASLRQHERNLSFGLLKEITWSKGGYALLLYRSALNPKISEAEWKATYQLGGLMQLHNDIFDLYRDVEEGILTLPRISPTVSELKDLFQEEIEKTYQAYNLLPIAKTQKQKFFLLLYLAVYTGFHALEQYKILEQKYGEFNPHKLSRKELVCDMDNIGKISSTVLATLLKKHL